VADRHGGIGEGVEAPELLATYPVVELGSVMVDAINRRRVLGILSVGLVVGPLAAGCTTLPACANGPDDKPGECLPWPKSPPAIGGQAA